MTASNIQRFNELTGLILASLYEHFPVPMLLEAKVVGISPPEKREFSNGGVGTRPMPTDEEKFFYETARWLADAGYLSFGPSNLNFSLRDARLTAKGLEVLNAFPASLTSGPSLGDKMLSASKSGAKEVLSGVVSEALGLGARMLTTQFGLPS